MCCNGTLDGVVTVSSLKPHAINDSGCFIGGWYASDTSICDELIQYHKDSPYKQEGLTTSSGGKVDKSQKDSTDVNLVRSDLARRYMELLTTTAQHYIDLYSYCSKMAPWGVIEPVAIQHYQPGGGYKVWHFERDNSTEVVTRRHLVFMTYLNDVEDGGGTEFYYQKLTFKAEKGLTLIWPAEWNFTHRGVVSPTQEKYIITGWFS